MKVPVEAICRGCGKRLRVGDEHAGKTIKCPGCKGPVSLPAAAAGDKITVACAACGASLRIAAEYRGKRIKCPKCSTAIDVGNKSDASTSKEPQAPPPPPRSAAAAAPPPPKAAAPPPKRSTAAPPPSRDGWHVHSHDGSKYGPITKAELDQWVAEGLISPDCQLLPAGGEWTAASEVYSRLRSAPELPPDYEPILQPLNKNSTLASVALATELPKTGRGNEILRSTVFQVGQARSFWEKVKANTHIGPFSKSSEIHIDQIHLMTVSDPQGEFHAIVGFDNGHPVPVEFLAVMPGQLPTSLGLLRGEGGNTGIAVANSPAGAFMPGIARMAISALGGQAAAVWEVLDVDEPPTAAVVAQGFPQLCADLRFDAKVLMGPMEITFHTSWIAQALPISDAEYLLIAKYIPQNKMIGMMDLGATWFIHWRAQFLTMAEHLPAEGEGCFCCYDYGNWGTVAYEALGLDVF